MITTETLETLKAKVREHGQYRQLAEETGLSESWLSKFATQPGENYTLRALQAVAAYFERQHGEQAAA